LCLPEVFWPGC